MVVGAADADKFLLAGDRKQYGVHSGTRAIDNPYNDVYKTSIHEHATTAGFDEVEFLYNTRCVWDISQMASDVFYHGRARNNPVTQTRKGAVTVRTVNNALFGIHSNLIFIDVAASRCQRLRGQTSKFNEETAGVSLQLADMLSQHFNKYGEKVLMLSPYSAQQDIHRRGLQILAQKDPSFADNRPLTFVGCQGAECSTSISDITVTAGPGFTKDDRMVSGALTRAKDGCYIVGDVQQLSQMHNFEHQPIGRVLTYCKKAGMVYTWPDQAITEEYRTIMPTSSQTVRDRLADTAINVDTVICLLCEKTGHLKRDCPYKGSVKCHFCHELGHKIKDCPDKPCDQCG
ncbi:MAG: hypothetical protein Q9162_002188 [Coniocarpon cinnabarinum]